MVPYLPEKPCLPCVHWQKTCISVITVQRAYEDLTRDGFIETVSGKGSFVASPNKEFIQEEQLRIAEELLEKVAIIGRTHGISYEQMANILKLFFEE